MMIADGYCISQAWNFESLDLIRTCFYGGPAKLRKMAKLRVWGRRDVNGTITLVYEEKVHRLIREDARQSAHLVTGI